MTVELINPDAVSRIRNATAEEALAGLQQWLIEQTNQMVIGARWLMRLDELGIAVECISEDMQLLLRQIGRGHILPEVVARFSSRVHTLRLIATLGVDDQKRLGSGGRIDLAEIQNSEITFRKVDPLRMTTAELKQVIRGGKIIPWDSQLHARPEAKSGKQAHVKCRADKRSGKILFDRKAVDPTEIRLALSGLSKRPLTLSDPTDCVSRKMARELVEILDVLAVERQCSRDEMVYRLILQAGI